MSRSGLSLKQRQYLRGKAHALKPIVLIGQAGLSTNLLAEAELALAHHELLKIKVNAADREARAAMIEQLCIHLQCQLVQRVGHIITVYRENPEQARIVLPKN